MNLVFHFIHCLIFVSVIRSTESAFENGVKMEKAGTVGSSNNANTGTLNQNQSNWNEKEAEALARLEIELEELLQSHLAVHIQQQEHQQQYGIRLRR